MYALYWEEGTLAIAPHIVLEEIGAPYKLHHVDLESEAHKTPDFLALNPAAGVPVLVDDSLTLTESAAICLYLAERHPAIGLLPAGGSPERATVLRWLLFAATTLQPAGRRMFYPERFSIDPADAPRVGARAREHLLDAWRLVADHALSAGPFVCGKAYSVADVYLVMLSTWVDDDMDLCGAYPAVGRLVDAARARPATRRALAQHGVE